MAAALDDSNPDCSEREGRKSRQNGKCRVQFIRADFFTRAALLRRHYRAPAAMSMTRLGPPPHTRTEAAPSLAGRAGVNR